MAVEINKRTFSVTQLGGFSPPINISAITANDYGYVTLSFGNFNTSNTAFIVVGPDGSAVEDGVGSQFMLNTDQAIKLAPASAGIQRPAHAGISDLLPGSPVRGRHDQKERVPAAPAAPIDATLYTRYNMDLDHTNVGWNVCGSLPGSSGCYGSGSLGPFGRVGAMMEGEPKTNRIANTVTRAIYVLDPASGPNQNEVVLYVYTKVDTITTDSDTVTVTLSQTISLPLVGGAFRPLTHRWQPISNSFSSEQTRARRRLSSTSVPLASPSLAGSRRPSTFLEFSLINMATRLYRLEPFGAVTTPLLWPARTAATRKMAMKRSSCWIL